MIDSPVTNEELLAIMYKALASPVGLLLSTSDFNRARARLYKARADALDSSLNRLQFRASPFPGGDLVICKGENQQP